MSKSEFDSGLQAGPRDFATTQWNIVLAAGKRGTFSSATALAKLCETYWYPVYAYVRRRGYSASDAQDCTQAFFTALLEKDYVRLADRERGRFRTFLLTAVSRFLSKKKAHDTARKRGGDRKVLSIDVEAGEERYKLEPVDRWTAERVFERRWALTLLERVLVRLGERYAEQGTGDLFRRPAQRIRGLVFLSRIPGLPD